MMTITNFFATKNREEFEGLGKNKGFWPNYLPVNMEDRNTYR